MSVQEYGNQPRIVVGVDGSESSLSALRWAIRQAGLTGESVDAVAAWHYPVAAGGFGYVPMGTGEDYDFKEITEKVLADAISGTVEPGSDVRVRGRVIEGNAAQVMLDASDGASLLVLGSRGHGGFAEALLGSVSQHCVHHARCPVLVVRGAGALLGGDGGQHVELGRPAGGPAGGDQPEQGGQHEEDQ